MEPTAIRAQAHGPALIRLLARISDVDTPPPSPSLATRLGHWLDWRQAVALSAALDARPAAPVPDPHPAVPGDGGEFARVRAALVKAIEGDRAFVAPTEDAGARGLTPDFPFFRQRHVALQQRMEAEVGHLRSRLRGRLVRQWPHLARLAAMDAVMERALGPRERALLSGLPDLLGPHFERLRPTAPDAPVAGPSPAGASATAPTAWLDAFRRDMRDLLLAELDIRLQPVQGLLAALSTPPTGSHAP